MKMQLDHWREIEANTQFKAPPGRIWVKCSEHCALYLTSMGVEVLAGAGLEVDVRSAEPLTGVVHAPEGARVFVYDPSRQYLTPTGEKYTNIDRKPMESGSVLAVRQALREMQLKQRGMMKELQAENRKAEARRKAEEARERASAPSEDPAPKKSGKATPAPAPEADADEQEASE